MIPTMWNLPAPPGFRGLDPSKPVTIYYRHLPHWRQDGASYFVTFRLADSLPMVSASGCHPALGAIIGFVMGLIIGAATQE